MKYSQPIMSNNLTRSKDVLNGLEGNAKDVIGDFYFAVFKELGILLLIYSGDRGFSEQWDLRKKFLITGKNIAASPGYSWHNFNRAVDVVPIKVDGSANWNSEAWPEIIAIGNRYGLENGKSFGDTNHFSYQVGTTLEKQRALTSGWQKYQVLEKELIKNKGLKGRPSTAQAAYDEKKKRQKMVIVGGVLLGIIVIVVVIMLYKKYGNR